MTEVQTKADPSTWAIARLEGRTVLLRNGQPHDGCMFWHSRPFDAAEDLRRFADAGVTLFTTGLHAAWQPDGSWDLSATAKLMSFLERAAPSMTLLPRVGLTPPPWWLDAHPEDVQVHLDVGNGDVLRRDVVFASPRWRDDMGRGLAALIPLLEERWGDRIAGYHLCAGACGEWAYFWGPVVSGYAPAQAEAFRAWLRQRGRPSDAEVPSRERRVRNAAAWPREWSCLDPSRDGDIIDYLTFHSEAVADAIVHFSRVTKQALSALHREKLCGVFYGYHVPNTETPHVAHNAGHHALQRVLASHDVDFVAAPYTYHERQAGGLYYSQVPTGSIARHGKLYYDEDDTFTHLARETPWRPKCRDAAETADVLWRNFAATLSEGGAYWWMDHDGEGWYRDDGLMREVAAMRRLAAACAAGGPPGMDGHRLDPTAAEPSPLFSPQIAVVVCPGTLNRLRYDSALVDALLPQFLSELIAVGAPYEMIEVADAPQLFGAPDASRFRLVVFPDALHLSAGDRAALKACVCRDGRTVLWLHAAGLLTERGVSVEALREVTGIGAALHDRVGPCRAETCVTGTRLTYGTGRDVGPEVVGCDPDAEVLGWTLYRGEPALLRKRLDGWTSIWSAVPLLPTVVLRQFAREAGVHVYADNGDRVWCGNGVLVLHACCNGAVVLRLPADAALQDARTGRLVRPRQRTLRLAMRRGETRVWRLMAAGAQRGTSTAADRDRLPSNGKEPEP